MRSYEVVCYGALFGLSLYLGVDSFVERHSARNRARDAVYTFSQRVTPEVIRETNIAADATNRGAGFLEFVNFAIAGIAGTTILKKVREN